jgi:hypothetical protein
MSPRAFGPTTPRELLSRAEHETAVRSGSRSAVPNLRVPATGQSRDVAPRRLRLTEEA